MTDLNNNTLNRLEGIFCKKFLLKFEICDIIPKVMLVTNAKIEITMRT